MKPDFSLLYSELNLPPDCSLEDFKCAYRRRIAELHPDRTGVDPSSPEAQAALPALFSTYVAVNRFHRRYGRMPGGLVAVNGPRSVQPASRSSLPISVSAGDESERPARSTVRLVILFIALMVLLATWDWVMFRSQ